jgi:D-glutamate cyclase
MADAIGEIEARCARVVRRNITRLAECVRGDLRAFAQSLVSHAAPRVAIVTGFYIPQGQPPAAETDGLSGAVLLATGLKRGGYEALLATDIPCYSALKAAAEGAPEPLDVLKSGLDERSVLALSEELLRRGTTHAIFIERAGIAADGHCYDMMGNALDAFTAKFDLLVEQARQAKVFTFGVGDGGNEIGMGKVALGIIAADIENGRNIACVTATDYSMVCGVSNWAGPALLAALAVIDRGKARDFLSPLDPVLERRILEHAVYLGPAIDDIGDPKTRPGRKVLWIDDIPLEEHVAMTAELRSLAEATA